MGPDKQTLDDLRIDRSTAPRGRLPGGMVVVLLAVAAAAGTLMWWLNRPKTFVVRTIRVEAPVAGTERTLLNASGYVTARRKTNPASKVTGKVMEVLVEEGMRVEEGQELARIDSSNVEKSLHLAEAQLESARKALNETKANLEQAERDLRRMAQLAAEDAASQAELDQAMTSAKAWQARLDRQQAEADVAESEVALWKQQLDDTIIRAPFAGIVTSKDAQPGEMISPMSSGGFTRTGICTIVDMSSLEIEVDVNESYINRVAAGQPAEAMLDSYPDWRIPARVIAIIPTADRQKATVKVRVGFEKLDPRILPDMSVKVAFQSAETPPSAVQPHVTVPRSAVRKHDGKDIVWVVNGDRVERRAVTVEDIVGDEVSIAAGLGGGERIVVAGPEDLAEGAQVTEEKQ